jgi:hypothetical protein
MVFSGPLTPQRSRRRLKIANLASFSGTTFSGHDDNFEPIVGSFPAKSRANICPQKRQSVPFPLPINMSEFHALGEEKCEPKVGEKLVFLLLRQKN